jgi:hypothetical protein
VTPDGTAAVRVPGSSTVIEVLRSLGDYQTFVLALQVSSTSTAAVSFADQKHSVTCSICVGQDRCAGLRVVTCHGVACVAFAFRVRQSSAATVSNMHYADGLLCCHHDTMIVHLA